MSLKDYFLNLLFENSDEKMRVFNIVHICCAIGMLFMCFAARFFIADDRGVYLTFGISMLFLITMIEANRTNEFRKKVLFMSVVFNFIYMPFMFVLFGQYLCVIPFYFLFGIVYSVMFFNIKPALILSLIEAVFYSAVLICGRQFLWQNTVSLSKEEITKMYLGCAIALIVSAIMSGIVIRMRFIVCRKLYSQSEVYNNEATDIFVAKDMFLTNMSHEIRTPMNAIVGNINLLIDKGVDTRVSDSIYSILNSCNALLSTVEGILDMSVSESGSSVNVVNAEYELDEFLMDIINMINVRLSESGLELYVDINCNIPRILIGDVSKIRKIMGTILNNAVTYTESGKIIIRADYKQINDYKIELIFDIEDTGIGIRKEDIDGIFYNNASDTENDSTLYSSKGASLAACADIIKKMDGSISVQSEYRVGTTFTVRIPQVINSDECISQVAESEDYSVLIYEKNEHFAEHEKKVISSLGVKAYIAKNESDFERLSSVNTYTHMLIDNSLADYCNAYLSSRLGNEIIVSILDNGDTVRISGASNVLTRPFNCMGFAALLNENNNNYVREVNRTGAFVCPNARIMVVDDNYTNLAVASSLLKKYEASVITAVSGKDCLRLLRENDVDLIFMDYMMPEMNGIDTLNSIRKLPEIKYEQLPVIVLTANVISGAKEKFLDAGFDDFMSKPIAIDKLERMLRRFLPKNLIISGNQQVIKK